MENWKDIKGYEGHYQISNFGRVRSLKFNKIKNIKEKVKTEYSHYSLLIGGIRKEYKTHLLVWDHFGVSKRDGRLIQVDHIDENKFNNRIDNLQLLSNRENCSKYQKTQKRTSEYIGVDKVGNRWRSGIRIDGKVKHLGYFGGEYDAHLAYEKELKEISDG